MPLSHYRSPSIGNLHAFIALSFSVHRQPPRLYRIIVLRPSATSTPLSHRRPSATSMPLSHYRSPSIGNLHAFIALSFSVHRQPPRLYRIIVLRPSATSTPLSHYRSPSIGNLHAFIALSFSVHRQPPRLYRIIVLRPSTTSTPLSHYGHSHQCHFIGIGNC